MSIFDLKSYVLLVGLGLSVAHAELAYQDYQPAWQNLTQHPDALHQFLEHFPKGADLHCHASGAASTEALMRIASKYPFCINQSYSLSVMQDGRCQEGTPTNIFFKDKSHQQAALKAWSMQGFHENEHEDGKTHFFNTFPKFDKLAKTHWSEIIASVASQAHQENIQYLELMMSMLGGKPSQDSLHIPVDLSTHAISKTLKKPEIHSFVEKNIAYYQHLKTEVKQFTPTYSQDVQLAWILEIKRNQPFEQFWLDAMEVFQIASQVPDVAAVNMVQPEYAPYANQDYVQQMEWLKTLKTYYPQVKVVLHAGEVPKAVAKENEIPHIKTAVEMVEPKRIGHGATIEDETAYRKTLKEMREKQVAVEVNLTSNDEILDIKGVEHPLHLFLMSKVPVVLSSDDPGVSRNTLSHEYWRAVHEQELSLQQLVQVDRNSLSYSLLPGASIWKDNNHSKPVRDCRDMQSKTCLKYIANSPKAYQQWMLEKRLASYMEQHLRVKQA
jgi:adenosine deaminase